MQLQFLPVAGWGHRSTMPNPAMNPRELVPLAGTWRFALDG